MENGKGTRGRQSVGRSGSKEASLNGTYAVAVSNSDVDGENRENIGATTASPTRRVHSSALAGHGMGGMGAMGVVDGMAAVADGIAGVADGMPCVEGVGMADVEELEGLEGVGCVEHMERLVDGFFRRVAAQSATRAHNPLVVTSY